MSNTYLVINGQRHMIQETIDHHRRNIASLCRIKRSQVKFRGYKKGKSILVHFSIPRENTGVLRLMANHSDPRLVYMGVKSLQIDTEAPIEVTRETMLYDFKRQVPADDIEVGCSTQIKQQRTPKNWTRLSALNLFSDALPLHLQVAESLEYQGFSYSLVRALAQRDRLREHQMKQLIQTLKKAEVDSNTFMTMRSELIIRKNELKEARETITVLEKQLQLAREDTEKAKQVMIRSHVMEYRGEKPPGGWSGQAEKIDVATQTHLMDDKRTKRMPGFFSAMTESDNGRKPEEVQQISSPSRKEQNQSKPAGAEGTTVHAADDGNLAKSKVTYGGLGLGRTFVNPRGVAVSRSNEIFVADTGNKQVQVHSIHGNRLQNFPTVVSGQLMEPHDVSVDNNGALWVVGRGKSADYVVQYNMDGTIVSKFDLPKVGDYRGIAVDGVSRVDFKRILVTEASREMSRWEIQVFTPEGDLVQAFRHPDSGMKLPEYVAVDEGGNILVTDSTTHSVYIFDEFGKYLFKFGGKGSGKGQMLYANGICTDSSGHIIVADCRNSRVQIFNSHGEYIHHIDNGCWTEGVAIGPDGHLVVTNFYDNTVSVYPSY
eukprot:XP_002605311.1 hypothetical protein BRAFLDRAFT_89047 [Branchiostoma floridae]